MNEMFGYACYHCVNVQLPLLEDSQILWSISFQYCISHPRVNTHVKKKNLNMSPRPSGLPAVASPQTVVKIAWPLSSPILFFAFCL